jgi:hypothetical protein
LRWRHPPPHRRLGLRVALVEDGHVLATSGIRFVRSGDPPTVFYSGEGDAGAAQAIGATLTLTEVPRGYDGAWAPGHCDTSKAASFPSIVDGNPISALAGYSLGRLGPIYFLRRAPERASQISYILLLDPGRADEFVSGCDVNHSIAPWSALQSWLAIRSSNRLVIMAGPITYGEEHVGIRAYYLRNLSAATLQSQVLVCDARVSHDDFMNAYGWMVGGEIPNSCPIGSKPYHVPKASSPPPTPGSVPAPTADGEPLPPGQFRVMHADGGVYWRSSPDWNTPVATPGNGSYPGTVIKVTCYSVGAANVPGSSNGMWEQASWVSGPGGGSGWINEHFIEDGAALNQPSPETPSCSLSGPSQPPPPKTWWEQETPNHPVNTFTNYHNASGMGPPIAAGQWIEVSCRVYDPTIASVNPDGYWYRIASSPWNSAYYSPANTFMNGDPYGGPYTHNTDFSVPLC